MSFFLKIFSSKKSYRKDDFLVKQGGFLPPASWWIVRSKSGEKTDHRLDGAKTCRK